MPVGFIACQLAERSLEGNDVIYRAFSLRDSILSLQDKALGFLVICPLGTLYHPQSSDLVSDDLEEICFLCSHILPPGSFTKPVVIINSQKSKFSEISKACSVISAKGMNSESQRTLQEFLWACLFTMRGDCSAQDT
jgi:hypothetical protein